PVPSSSDEACVTTAGTYTVTLEGGVSGEVKALTIGASSGTQKLAIATSTCEGYAILSASSAVSVKAHGRLSLASTGMCGYYAKIGAATITNSGVVSVESGQGYLEGDFTNKGALNLAAPTSLTGSLTNEGGLKLSESTALSIAGPLTEGAGGSISSPGKAVIGIGSNAPTR